MAAASSPAWRMVKASMIWEASRNNARNPTQADYNRIGAEPERDQVSPARQACLGSHGPDPDGTSLTGYLHRYPEEVPTHELPGWVLDRLRTCQISCVWGEVSTAAVHLG